MTQFGSVGLQAGSKVSPGLYEAKAKKVKQKNTVKTKEFNITSRGFLGNKNLTRKENLLDVPTLRRYVFIFFNFFLITL
jgi:hypothetical protein